MKSLLIRQLEYHLNAIILPVELCLTKPKPEIE
nr:MAG TPA: hypothetical protein [Caudoviricetes sp.]